MKRIFLVRFILFLLIIFSVIYSIGAVQLKIGTPTMPGPGFMPLLLGIFLSGASTISLAVSYRGKSVSEEKNNEERVLSLATLKKPILMCIAVIVYALVLNRLGYIISVFLLMLVLFKGIDPQGWFTALIAATLTTAVSYFIFIYWLGIQIV
jgi:hypothetical protein